MKRVSFSVVLALLLSATGCGGGSSGGGGGGRQPPTPPAIVAVPATLSFTALGPLYTQVVTVSEPNYGGAFRVEGSACSKIVLTMAVSQGKFSVQPLAAGTCALQFADSAGRTGSIAVTVTETKVGGQ